MTQPQDIYNITLNHLRTQGRASVNFDSDGSYPRYRDSRGNMCAIGCHISEANYSPELEGRNVFYRPVRQAANDKATKYLTLLADMQHAHDFILIVEKESDLPAAIQNWELEMQKIAVEHKIIYPPRP